MLEDLANQLKEKATLAIQEHVNAALQGGQQQQQQQQQSHSNSPKPAGGRRDSSDNSHRNRKDDEYDDGDRYDDRRHSKDHQSHKHSDSSHRRRNSRDDSSGHGNGRRYDDRDDDRRYNDRDDDDSRKHSSHQHSNHHSSSNQKNSSKHDGFHYTQPTQMSHGETVVQKVPGMDKSYKVSNCRGNRKALFIGINYTGSDVELRGCINDVKNIRAFVEKNYGYTPDRCVQLTDDQEDKKYQPTRANIISAFHWLVAGAQPGDSLFLHYSGHGSTTEDLDGDEKDGQDETIVPVDHLEAGQIVDDEIHEILVRPLKEGVRLTAIFDCCHSGTVMDLPFVYSCRGEIELVAENHHKEVALALFHAGANLKRGNVGGTIAHLKEGFRLLTKEPESEEAQKRAEKEKRSDADVIQFSGCRDDQTSADTIIANQATGAMSHALIKVLTERPNIRYTELLYSLRKELQNQYTQVPQMSTGRPMDMESNFVM